jgi:RimJ/RimL family protein N-acetyltransferase
MTVKPIARGKKLYFREVTLGDAEFILNLRTNPTKNRFLSQTVDDVSLQRSFIQRYQLSLTDYYFVICNWQREALGTVRIYDIQGDSFCWGSWILSEKATATAAIESALLLYDFAFYSLHYSESHFDVRKENLRVVDFHKRFGAKIIREDDLNFYFNYSLGDYASTREKYLRFLV